MKTLSGGERNQLSMRTDAAETFEAHRPLLFSIAYRMLGTVMDAEDMVQETVLRWQSANRGEIESPKAWLSTVITRLCINQLSSARVQREKYVGPWLPEPLLAELATDLRENARLVASSAKSGSGNQGPTLGRA